MLGIYLTLISGEENRTAFEKLYEKYHDDIFRRVSFYLRERADAEDVMQETWKTVCLNMDFFRVKDEASVKAYIMKIARNKAVSLYRRQRKEQELFSDIDEGREVSDGESDSVLLSLCADHSVQTVTECIMELDEKYSDVLNFYFLNGSSIREISALTGASEATVRTRLRRGRKKLCEMLIRRGIHD